MSKGSIVERYDPVMIVSESGNTVIGPFINWEVATRAWVAHCNDPTLKVLPQPPETLTLRKA